MKTYEEVLNFIEEENVKFIRLAFFDVFGRQRNIAVMPGELRRAFQTGIAINAAAIDGFGEEVRSDLFLKPDPTTMSMVPWRPLDGGVCRMFCDIYYPDGRPFEKDTRYMLRKAIRDAAAQNITVLCGPKIEFYVFRQDENGRPTKEPIDHAGYMAVGPEDRGENLRRDICFTLLDMGITPESSHHEAGPGQNEVDFHYSDPLTTADNISTFKWAVRNLADSNGMWADFSAKPLAGEPGNGMHMNLSVHRPGDKPMDESSDHMDLSRMFMAGIMRHIREMTLFLNPTAASYDRFGQLDAPYYISWSEQNRSQLIRIPAAPSGRKRMELRSPDPEANPYLAYALILYAGLDGVTRSLKPDVPMNVNLYHADPDLTKKLDRLPTNLQEAVQCAKTSDFIKEHVSEECLAAYTCR